MPPESGADLPIGLPRLRQSRTGSGRTGQYMNVGSFEDCGQTRTAANGKAAIEGDSTIDGPARVFFGGRRQWPARSAARSEPPEAIQSRFYRGPRTRPVAGPHGAIHRYAGDLAGSCIETRRTLGTCSRT
jgi:hypothetical protein